MMTSCHFKWRPTSEPIAVSSGIEWAGRGGGGGGGVGFGHGIQLLVMNNALKVGMH